MLIHPQIYEEYREVYGNRLSAAILQFHENAGSICTGSEDALEMERDNNVMSHVNIVTVRVTRRGSKGELLKSNIDGLALKMPSLHTLRLSVHRRLGLDAIPISIPLPDLDVVLPNLVLRQDVTGRESLYRAGAKPEPHEIIDFGQFQALVYSTKLVRSFYWTKTEVSSDAIVRELLGEAIRDRGFRVGGRVNGATFGIEDWVAEIYTDAKH